MGAARPLPQPDPTMAIVIDATVGGASSNSFVLLTEAQSYMDGRLNESAWEAATADSQNRALVEATRELSIREWKGRRASTTQALSWPRWWVVNPDSPMLFFYDSTIIPQRVKDATCELALQFVKAGSTDVAAEDALQNITRDAVGPLSTSYQDPWLRTRGIGRYPSVMRYIRLLLGVGDSVRVLRG